MGRPRWQNQHSWVLSPGVLMVDAIGVAGSLEVNTRLQAQETTGVLRERQQGNKQRFGQECDTPREMA